MLSTVPSQNDARSSLLGKKRSEICRSEEISFDLDTSTAEPPLKKKQISCFAKSSVKMMIYKIVPISLNKKFKDDIDRKKHYFTRLGELLFLLDPKLISYDALNPPEISYLFYRLLL